MASGNAIRGSRVGAGPMGEAERGDAAPRFRISYWCANGHETEPSFSEEAGVQPPDDLGLPPLRLPGRARTRRTRRRPRATSRTRRTSPT